MRKVRTKAALRIWVSGWYIVTVFFSCAKRGAAAVCEMLAVNTTLTTVSLKFDYIPDPLAIKYVHHVCMCVCDRSFLVGL